MSDGFELRPGDRVLFDGDASVVVRVSDGTVPRRRIPRWPFRAPGRAWWHDGAWSTFISNGHVFMRCAREPQLRTAAWHRWTDFDQRMRILKETRPRGERATVGEETVSKYLGGSCRMVAIGPAWCDRDYVRLFERLFSPTHWLARGRLDLVFAMAGDRCVGGIMPMNAEYPRRVT